MIHICFLAFGSQASGNVLSLLDFFPKGHSPSQLVVCIDSNSLKYFLSSTFFDLAFFQHGSGLMAKSSIISTVPLIWIAFFSLFILKRLDISLDLGSGSHR